MPVIPIATTIDYGKITEYLLNNDIRRSNFFGGAPVDKRHPLLLYMENTALINQYATDPSDTTLEAVSAYVYSLTRPTRAQSVLDNASCIVPVVTTQPVSQSVDNGDDVVFSVVASGTTPFFYQWRKNGVDLTGEISSTLLLSNVTSTDEGAYSVMITNNCGSAISGSATLTVVSNLTVYAYYGSTDYYAALSGGTDAITYQLSFSIVHNAAISVAYPIGAANNMYLVIKVPEGESTKTTWFNTVLNNGTFPDAVFRDSFVMGVSNGYRYYVSRVAVSNDFPTNPLVLS